MTDNLENLSFEEAMQELEQVVRQLETGKVKLEDAVSAYEKGVALQNNTDSLTEFQYVIDHDEWIVHLK